jgi:hypothetical protein
MLDQSKYFSQNSVNADLGGLTLKDTTRRELLADDAYNILPIKIKAKKKKP